VGIQILPRTIKHMKLLTPNEVAEHLRVTPATVRNLIRRGDLPAFQLPGSRGIYRIEEQTLLEWLQPPRPKPLKKHRGDAFKTLTVRAQNIVFGLNLSLEDLAQFTPDEIKKCRGVGPGVFQELDELLKSNGMKWA